MNRRIRLAVAVGLVLVAGAVVALGGTTGSEPQPTPSRMYSSCLAIDNKPGDPCGEDR
ncbi:hypothetical protein [Streptomyces sp. NPDC049906]|uniref:hypothetical protein n=1 Tax=Streptomyces sp. NPDC049906 TaxID=3155656 RepID=UPI0034301702